MKCILDVFHSRGYAITTMAAQEMPVLSVSPVQFVGIEVWTVRIDVVQLVFLAVSLGVGVRIDGQGERVGAAIKHTIADTRDTVWDTF